MSQSINQQRRRFLGIAGGVLAVSRLGFIGSAQAQAQTKAALPAVKAGSHTSIGPVKQINAGVLDTGYVEMGPATGPAVILLHGWPYDIHSYADVAPALAEAGYRVIVPHLRGYGTTRFLSSDTMRSGQPVAVAADIVALMDALKIEKAVLGGYDWGARTANIMAVLWPERCKAMVSVSGYLIGSQAAGKVPLSPKAELQWWYQFYFATERGREGYAKNRHDFAKLIWQLASPQWKFDDATYDRSAAAFENPDHVDIVIHNYRWRLGLAEGEAKYDAFEKTLAQAPVIAIPTITMEGDANGAPHPEPAAYAKKFSGHYEHRTLAGGIGHNLPQEAPQAFTQAIIDISKV
ncbi:MULTISPECIES: alpha/beta fold hydrolase [unclassified Bradyrhizobium]|uniref:alpha/beta fold hydrolase n=1 Tax=unclassified Bradyrhizobium TaxID=2631580 RepID=UPI001BAA0644|nr:MULTISPECIES: alpha/beta hydrolase [unclassified Bradyrhizobium]MBR1205873.1 alpha/beta hydrolase [Bradyrhizobium sp. AUGA SZCCT0124]MBR1315738.1 alpha/beta hydrolase [Bradyrhizobium sp. AUGA SZCCT0051]MBR1338200.1 alpha/beta hydrolase [Bradyrhizobium sp. AUGA SZCCT0105]MBR1355855.1 alpha/beta hydrolase [Bradyrhizobium sp. AUGA SZCCT0045]